MDPTQPLMSTHEVAEALDVAVPTVTRWVLANRIQPIYKGRGLRGAYLFHKTEVERFRALRDKTFEES
jgi:excisionase family DNA binding protein